MLPLLSLLRERALKLHGLRIEILSSGEDQVPLPIADIGLKEVRVRRSKGTCACFDVYLGAGLSGLSRLGICYRTGIELHQLPELVEDVVRDYYLRHKPGYTFSTYWREKLQIEAADRGGDDQKRISEWICDNCNQQQPSAEPPLLCRNCGGSQGDFARLDTGRGTRHTAPVSRVVKDLLPQ